MAQSNALESQPRFGETARKDTWWLGPLATFLGLSAFIVYSTWAGMTGKYFEIRQDQTGFSGHEVAPYLSPFYAPLIYDAQSPHAWFKAAQPGWWPSWFPMFSSAILILWGPALFRLTCYYYRKAYYRSFWADPLACAVGEPRKSYWGENSLPLILQNAHRFAMYVAVVFLALLWWDALHAFCWPADASGKYLNGEHQFGMGLGTLVMLLNVVFLSCYTFGCHSLRHLVGGRMDCFSCIATGQNKEKLHPGYHAWRFTSLLNEHHMLWAWCSLCSVGLTDVYIRLCSMGIIHDVRFF